MNKIKTITLLLLLSACGPLFAQTDAEGQDKAAPSQPECVRGCTSSEPEVTILNKRNRYTDDGAAKRRMYPRFLHSRIKAEKVVCDCEVCHAAPASAGDGQAQEDTVKPERKKLTKEEIRKKKQLYPRHILVR